MTAQKALELAQEWAARAQEYEAGSIQRAVWMEKSIHMKREFHLLRANEVSGRKAKQRHLRRYRGLESRYMEACVFIS